MTNDSRRGALALELLKMFPPVVAEKVLDLDSFRREFSLRADAEITFNEIDVTFRRSGLFRAVRDLDVGNAGSVRDRSGVAWAVARDGASSPRLTFQSEARTMHSASFWPLFKAREDRLAIFQALLAARCIIDDEAAKWAVRLDQGPLVDDEVDDLLSYVFDHPLDVSPGIRSAISDQEISLPDVIPHSARYYGRLIAPPGDAGQISEYCKQCVPVHFEHLYVLGNEDALKLAFLVCAHPNIAAALDLTRFPEPVVRTVFDWIAQAGDRYSQVAAFEAGSRIVAELPYLNDYLVQLFDAVADDAGDNHSGFELAAALFVLVDAEFARIGLFRQTAPFWRRAAALAQAGLIEREVVAQYGRQSKFDEWVRPQHGLLFALNNYADMHRAPRWSPDLAAPALFRGELLMRVMAAGARISSEDCSEELYARVSRDGRLSLTGRVQPFWFVPNPLEGEAEPPVNMPKDIAPDWENASSDGVVDAQIFIALINSARIFKIPVGEANMAADLLRRCKFQVNFRESATADAFVLGLASLAAAVRSTELQEGVRVLCRVARRTHPDWEAFTETRVLLTACAAHSGKSEWVAAVGDWVTELAFEVKGREELLRLKLHLDVLLLIEPELWRTCSRAVAALSVQN